MKPTKEQLEAYKEMAKSSPDSMKAMIESNLKETCDKFAGHEDRLDDCIDYLTECAREILDHKNGEVDKETCYRICRDYFNDEVWKAEDEEKAKHAAEAAEAKKKEADRKVKLARRTAAKEKKGPKKAVIKSTPTPPNPIIEAAKKEPEKPKFLVCPECGKQFINLYEGVCLVCYDKKRQAEEKAKKAELERMKADAACEAESMKPESGQLDFFAAMEV